eukprot:76116_1
MTPLQPVKEMGLSVWVFVRSHAPSARIYKRHHHESKTTRTGYKHILHPKHLYFCLNIPLYHTPHRLRKTSDLSSVFVSSKLSKQLWCDVIPSASNIDTIAFGFFSIKSKMHMIHDNSPIYTTRPLV